MKENGSTACGTRAEDSDVDVAILLHAGATKTMRDQMLDLVVDLELECGRVLSVLYRSSSFQPLLDIVLFNPGLQPNAPMQITCN